MKTRLTYVLTLLASGILALSSCSKTASVSADNSKTLAKTAATEEGSKSPEVEIVETADVEAEKAEKAAPAMKADKEELMKAAVDAEKVSAKAKKETGKMTLGEKLVQKKIEKLAKKSNLAEKLRTTELDQNLKIAVILAIIALILMLLPWPFSLIGYICLIVALIFLLLWVLNSM